MKEWKKSTHDSWAGWVGSGSGWSWGKSLKQDFCFSMTLCFIITSRNKLRSHLFFPSVFSLRCCVKGQRVVGTRGRHIVEQFAVRVSLCETLSSARYWFMGSAGTKGNKIITKYKFPSKSSAWRECVNSQRCHLSYILVSSHFMG